MPSDIFTPYRGDLPEEPFEPAGHERWDIPKPGPAIFMSASMLFTIAGHNAALTNDPTADPPEITGTSSSFTGSAVTTIPDSTLGVEYRADDPDRQRGGIVIKDLATPPKTK